MSTQPGQDESGRRGGRSSTFVRLLMANALVAVVAVLVVGLLGDRLLSRAYLVDRRRDLTLRASQTAQALETRAGDVTGDAFGTALRRTAALLADRRGLVVWIDASGSAVLVLPRGFLRVDRFGEAISPARFEGWSSRLMSGEAFVDQLRAPAGFLSEADRGAAGQPTRLTGKERVLILAAGSPVRETSTGIIRGGVVLLTPVQGVDQLGTQLTRLVWLAGLAALSLSLALSYPLARRLTAPLISLKRAAAEVARGRFDLQVDVSGDGEVAELAHAFNRMAGELARQESSRRDFLANVSHELRTPLTSLRGFVQALLDGTIPPGDRDRYLSLVHGELERLSRLVSELLDLARLDAGQFQLELRLADLWECLKRVAAQIEPEAARKGVTLRAELPEKPLGVRIDPDRIGQVAWNLLGNAVKFSPSGGTVTLGGQLIGSDGRWVEFAVTDEGPGIAQEDLPHVFERFYKADRSRRSGSGTGLGLPIARQLVEAHGGTIRVETMTGRGSRFTVRLPVRT